VLPVDEQGFIYMKFWWSNQKQEHQIKVYWQSFINI